MIRYIFVASKNCHLYMNAKESLCTLLETLATVSPRMQRQLLIDFVVGNVTPNIKKEKLEEHELFGSGDKHDDDHYTLVLEQALKDKLIKQKGQWLTLTLGGKRMLKDDRNNPYLVSEDDQAEPDGDAIERAQHLTRQDDSLFNKQKSENIGGQTKTKIKLIQAMDRQISLDYFAEQNNLAFDEVLTQLEEMQQSGRTFDISYFVNEVMDEPSQRELSDYFEKTDGNLQSSIEEWGDVYKVEELRLALLYWRLKK